MFSNFTAISWLSVQDWKPPAMGRSFKTLSRREARRRCWALQNNNNLVMFTICTSVFQFHSAYLWKSPFSFLVLCGVQIYSSYLCIMFWYSPDLCFRFCKWEIKLFLFCYMNCKVSTKSRLIGYWWSILEFCPLVIWIWNQNIAISTIVGTSSHINTFVCFYWFHHVSPILSVILTKYHLYNNIVLSMLYAEICPKVRRHNARPVHYPF
jgi:multisubunit Na+/H+ antiporter MnhB subunit